MMSLRCSARTIAPAVQRLLAPRALSTQTTQAVAKLQRILENYRQANYTQETPTRFKKEIVRATIAAGPNHGIVLASGLERVLFNIGAAHQLTTAEVQSIFAELGNEQGEIPAQTLVQLL